MTRLTGKSEAQSIAESRSRTYADEHIVSVIRANDVRSMPQSVGGLLYSLRQSAGDEIPRKLHDGPHQIDEGGTPRWSAAFSRYLMDNDGAQDQQSGVKLTPFRAALTGMGRSQNETKRRYASIVARIVLNGDTMPQAAEAEGVPSWCAKVVSEEACRAVWSDMKDRNPLPKRTVAA